DVTEYPVSNACEIWLSRCPIIGTAEQLDRVVWLEIHELERAGADRALPHLTRRNMAGIDRRPPRRQQREQPRLRPFQMKGDLVIAIGGHFPQITVPGFARVDAQLFARLAGQKIPGALDVGGSERLAVVPFDALAQRENQLGAFLVPRPSG